MDPLGDDGIYVVTEAYSTMHGWAEGSVKVADQVLEKYFDVPRPWDFAVEDIEQPNHDTSSETTCVGGAAGGNATTGGGGAGSAGDTEDAFCFTATALVEMADGTLKAIKDVREGDLVNTGTGHGNGLVTSTLVHPIDRKVAVTVTATKLGTLVGTPSHPVLQDGEWIEYGKIAAGGGGSDPTQTAADFRYVDAFYNLEIDGDKPGQSSHSYVVNGVVASGLGDDEVLNLMHPRQASWKEQVATAATL